MRSRGRSRRLALLAVLGALVLPQAALAQTVVDPDLAVRTAATGLSQPTGMAFIGENDILVNQKANGQVRRVTNGVLQTDPVLDLAVNSNSERGLLGMALDRKFLVNGYVYLYWTAELDGRGHERQRGRAAPRQPRRPLRLGRLEADVRRERGHAPCGPAGRAGGARARAERGGEPRRRRHPRR